MITPEDKKEIERMITLSSQRNFDKRIGDTPTDALQLVPQKYVDANGTIAQRPKNPNKGQQYFVTGAYPIFYNSSIMSWVSATGSVVSAK